MRVQLNDHFNYRKLFRFVLPPILMMVFTSIYNVVDGFFIANYTGKTPFAAINLIWPFLMVLGSIGFMLGTGGTAIVAKLLGEKKQEDANKYFSLLIYVTFISGVIFTVVGEILLPYVAQWLGAQPAMLPYCLTYGRIVLSAMPFYMLQNVFQSFFSAAEKPTLGFIVTLTAGCTNIVLDAILVAVLKLGVTGAALATCISQTIGAVIPVIYFTGKNSSLLRLGKPKFSWRVIYRACSNGVSEFISNISASIVAIVFNFQLMRLIGENGVAAYGIMMYVNFIYVAIFIGYAIGTAPLIAYNHGADNTAELKNIFRKSVLLMGICGVAMTTLAFVLAEPIANIFLGYDSEVLAMTKHAFRLYSFSFIFSGFSIFTSSMFTAFGNGIISAIISFLRTIVFQLVTVLILPIFFGVTGVWIAMILAEILSMMVAGTFCLFKRKKYHYL